MPARLGPRFALETLFLIAIGVGAGFADLSAAAIALVMGVGWLIVALFEYTTYRLTATLPALRRAYYAAPPPAVPVAEPAAPAPPEPVAAPPPPPPPPTRPPEEATVVVERPAAEPEPEPELAPEADEREIEPVRAALEPLEPRPKRRWLGLRRAERAPDEDELPEPAPAQPRHVRLLPPRAGRSSAEAEVAEIFDDDAREERGRA
jgi:hypothetical protein